VEKDKSQIKMCKELKVVSKNNKYGKKWHRANFIKEKTYSSG